MKDWTVILMDREGARSLRVHVPRWSLWVGLCALLLVTLAAGWAGDLLGG